MRFIIIGLLSLVTVLHGSGSLRAADIDPGQTLAILPLEVSQKGRYAYLNSAINQMLISRLSRQSGIEVVGSPIPEKKVVEIKGHLQSGNYGEAVSLVSADWLVDGSMYSLKDGLQVNLTLYPAESGKRPLNFGFKAEGPDNVIPAIANMSDEIRESVVPTEAADPAAAGEGDLAGFQTPHPERAYKKGLYSGATMFGGEGDDRFQSKGVRRSSTIPVTVESVALGDLDGDGTNELVTASRSKIRVFRFSDNRFTIIAEYDFHPGMKIHMINIADPDESGQMRLYVSANEGKYPSSSIFTWDGSEKLQLVQEKIRWYIRPVWWPKKGVILAGQQDSPNISDNFLMPGVFELAWNKDKNRFERTEQLLLPEKTNLFDFVVADLDGDKIFETMVIDKRQKLLVYDEVLNLVWVSSANYGGSKKFFGPPIAEDDKQNTSSYDDVIQGMRKLEFIAGRLEVKDITGDGLPEVVVSTNEVGASEYLNNFRSYDGGSVACLSWRGFGLMELWRTNHITGYVADYAFDGDGQLLEGEESVFMNRLYVAQNPDATMWETILPGGDASKILAYEMAVRKGE
jgi:TolB-like protein